LTRVNKWHRKYQKTRSIANKSLERTFKKIDSDKLKAYMEKYPNAYLKEIGEVFGCTDMAIYYAFKGLGSTRKKRQIDIKNKIQ